MENRKRKGMEPSPSPPTPPLADHAEGPQGADGVPSDNPVADYAADASRALNGILADVAGRLRGVRFFCALSVLPDVEIRKDGAFLLLTSTHWSPPQTRGEAVALAADVMHTTRLRLVEIFGPGVQDDLADALARCREAEIYTRVSQVDERIGECHDDDGDSSKPG